MRNRPRRWQHLTVSAAALLLVVTGMLAVAAPASASTVQVVPGGVGLNRLACASATTCEAVGYNASGQSVVVPITNGIPGTPQVVPGDVGLNSVACPTATTCLAVGTNDSGGLVVPITNGIPGTPILAVPGFPGSVGELGGVACASATACVAWGSPGLDGSWVVPITNGIPGIPLGVPEAIDDVACPTATTCEAVAQGSENIMGGYGVVVPITNGIPGTPLAMPGGGIFQGVACASATTCEAVGYITESGQNVVVPITNGIPGNPQVTLTRYGLVSVACPSATTCLAVGYGVVVPITNGIPGTPLAMPGIPFLGSVACPTATTCLAVGYNASGQGVVVPVLQASSTHVPLSVGLCQNGGWQNLTNEQGQPFGSQGACITYLTHNP